MGNSGVRLRGLSLPDFATPQWIELKLHLIHKHSVTEVQMKNDGPPVFCDGCGDPVLGPSYNCHCREAISQRFIFHKSCVEVPYEIHHPIHRKHPLTLESMIGSDKETSCSACHQNCIGTLYYSCSQCEFNIDLQCASICRDHKFTRYKKPAQLPCEVCGEDSISTASRHGNALYHCSICQLLVHKDCSWLPSHVKTAQHQHRLKLTWWFEDTFPKIQNLCGFCYGNMGKSRAVYYCEHECCSYVAHNLCATEHHQAVQDSAAADDMMIE